MQWLQLRWRQFRLWLIAGGPRVNALGYAAVLAVALALQAWPSFQYAEWKLYDQSLKLLRALTQRPVANDVVIVAVDEESFSAFDEPFALWHKRLGALVDAMTAAQPAVLGLDIVLPAKSYDSVIPGIDRELLAPLLRARGKLKIVAGQTVDDELRPRAIFPGFVALIGAQQLASAVLCFDEDSVVRRVLAQHCGNAGEQHQGLAQRMAVLMGAPGTGQGLIDFRSGLPFQTISMAQVLRWQAEGQTVRLQEAFGGKAVLLGVVLPLEDRLKAPVALLGAEPGNTRVPGVLLHAQILRTLLNHGYIHATPRWMLTLMTVLVCLCWFGYGFRKNLLYWTLFAMVPLLGLYALWLGYALPSAALLVSAKIAYVARQGLEAMRLNHQRNQLTRAFAGHVSPRLIRRVLASDAQSGGSGELAPQRLQATAMWVRLPTEAAMRPHDPPAFAAQALAPFFNAVQQAVQRGGGMIERFQGGNVLAYFGAPLPLRNAPRAALEAALSITRSRPAWGRPLADASGALPRVCIGIASGEVLSGQVSMQRASPFIVLGPAVDDAAWLSQQPALAGDGASVLVSASAAQSVDATGLQPVRLDGVDAYSLTVR